MSVADHKSKELQLKCMVISVSDTRNKETDKSGRLISELLEISGHRIDTMEIVPDEKGKIRQLINEGKENPDIDVILTNGGTGIAYRDVTIETVKPLLDKEIPGFGEIFRSLSYSEDIGSAAILSRAIAGIANHTAVFSMPGSSGAVRLAMNKLILPELSHVVNEIQKDI
ncbi:molybdenum cofactor biosynthesis protein [Virgibacillus phasianinus]|uniref:Molybdenum cofactor biosynthesis protein B n=1 Tax=Virgibacillus phasianinus TaxID=2017483 RepID=A0A220U5F3_9BACI|nr:MogA/MoaB family molybdenum cofactor biosynthesis protein [Virgibacillus phasianinus]ASK62953.1 molybdenum cofactor biosynthesis protein [Virgibacillus phasianinus]